MAPLSVSQDSADCMGNEWYKSVTRPGLEPGISGSGGRRLIHWANGPISAVHVGLNHNALAPLLIAVLLILPCQLRSGAVSTGHCGNTTPLALLSKRLHMLLDGWGVGHGRSTVSFNVATWSGATNSATGTRTRVARVRAEYPNQLDYSGLASAFLLLLHEEKHPNHLLPSLRSLNAHSQPMRSTFPHSSGYSPPAQRQPSHLVREFKHPLHT